MLLGAIRHSVVADPAAHSAAARMRFVLRSEVVVKSGGQAVDATQLLKGEFPRGQGMPKAQAHGWPFTCSNGEHDGVAESAVRSN